MCPHSSSSELPTTSTEFDSNPGFVPQDAMSQSAFQYAREHLHPLILAHSLRVFLHAKELGERESSSWATTDRLPLLFVAAIFHDVGTTSAHDGPVRFEIEGADAAVSHLKRFAINERDVHEAWVAIALHTSQQIAERISALARLIRLGVAIDFKLPNVLSLSKPGAIQEIEGKLPRGEIEKVLGDAVVEQALRQPDKAPTASWPGVLLRSKKENPDWQGVNKAF